MVTITLNMRILKLSNLAVCSVFTQLRSITTQSPGGRGLALLNMNYLKA